MTIREHDSKNNDGFKVQNWPLVYSEVLEIGNVKSNIAICSLWTPRKVIARKFDPNTYAVIGNLYSTEGVSPIIRNIYANPNIRYIVLWGNDLSESGSALVEFMESGVDGNFQTPSGQVQIEREIDLDSIDQFRANILLLDLREATEEEVRKKLGELPSLAPFNNVKQFPIAKESRNDAMAEIPSELSGFRLSSDSIPETWLHILYLIMRFGRIKRTKYGSTNELREVSNLVAVVTKQDPDQHELPAYLPISREQLEKYYPQVLEDRHPEDADYSYGQRLRNYDGFDQIAQLIDKVKSNPNSKRLFASTWKVNLDSVDNGSDAPCLTQINVLVQDEQLLMTAHFRSQDMFGAWPLNAFAVRKLQGLISKQSGIPIGPMTIVTHSAHIYGWDWQRAHDLIDVYKKHRRPAAELDPRGYVTISLRGNMIEAKLLSYDNKVIDTIADQTARKIGLEVTRRMWIADPGHAIYVGRELAKAEFALKTKTTYIQDSPISEQ